MYVCVLVRHSLQESCGNITPGCDFGTLLPGAYQTTGECCNQCHRCTGEINIVVDSFCIK